MRHGGVSVFLEPGSEIAGSVMTIGKDLLHICRKRLLSSVFLIRYCSNLAGVQTRRHRLRHCTCGTLKQYTATATAAHLAAKSGLQVL